MAEWRIIDRGRVPDPPSCVIQFSCPNCGHEADLPVLGLPMAHLQSGVVFDLGDHAMPAEIRCKKCRKHFASGKGD